MEEVENGDILKAETWIKDRPWSPFGRQNTGKEQSRPFREGAQP